MILRIVVGEISEEKSIRELIRTRETEKNMIQFLTPDQLLHANLNNIFEMIDNNHFSDVNFSCSHMIRGTDLNRYKFFVDQIRIYYQNKIHFKRTYPTRMKNFRANIRKILPKHLEKKAVICGAGPSFNAENIEIIKHNPDLIKIIVGHAAGTAKKYGLDPDYVVEIDQDAGKNWQGNKYEYNCPLVAPPTMNPEVINRFNDVIWCSPGDVFDKHLRKILPNYLRIQHNKGVIITAVNFAYHIGCNDCILVGNDLAYTEKPTNRDESELHQVLSVNNEPIWTTIDYMMIASAIENYLEDYWPDKISVSSIPFGAFIRGMAYRTLNEFMMDDGFDFHGYAEEKGIYLSSVTAEEKQCLEVI